MLGIESRIYKDAGSLLSLGEFRNRSDHLQVSSNFDLACSMLECFRETMRSGPAKKERRQTERNEKKMRKQNALAGGNGKTFWMKV